MGRQATTIKLLYYYSLNPLHPIATTHIQNDLKRSPVTQSF